MKYYIKLNGNKIIGWLVDVKDTKNCIEVDVDTFNENMNNGSNCYIKGVFSNVDFRTADDKKQEELDLFRVTRNARLSKVDFYQMSLVYDELTTIQKKELKEYRIALLDSTKTQIIPDEPTWFK